MKASRYNIVIPLDETRQTILFNSFTGSISVWEQCEVAGMKQALAAPDVRANNENAAMLFGQGNLIADDFDEFETLKASKLAAILDNTRLDLIVIPTVECNFACPYCFEQHRPEFMDDRTELALKRWLTQQIPLCESTTLNWFGGEPLLAWERVVAISRHARETAAGSNRSFHCSMTTNGYLLTPECGKALLDAGIFEYQVTLDGIPETHDKLRKLRDGAPTFHRIYAHILRILHEDDRVRVTVRVNYNKDNIHTIPLLLEMFPEEVRKNMRVVFEPIFGECRQNALAGLTHAQIAETIATYSQKAETLGYCLISGLANTASRKSVFCYAEREHQYAIAYNGNVYKCCVSEFTGEDRVAILSENGELIKLEPRWSSWMEAPLIENECETCAYLPLCAGGCRKTRLKNRRGGMACNLTHATVEAMVKKIVLEKELSANRTENLT